MLLVIIGVFFCCWGPKWTLNVLKRHRLDILYTDQAFLVMVGYLTVHSLSMHPDCSLFLKWYPENLVS